MIGLLVIGLLVIGLLVLWWLVLWDGYAEDLRKGITLAAAQKSVFNLQKPPEVPENFGGLPNSFLKAKTYGTFMNLELPDF